MNSNISNDSNQNFDKRSSDLTSNKNSAKVNDIPNYILLFFFYLLQGIPLGLQYSVPMILQKKGITYKQQAQLSMISWPFSLKLLWAPIVDSFYLKKIGRRKSWLVPTQLAIGIFLILISFSISNWMGENNEKININLLTISLFILCFLVATQDISVDGWCLTMLDKSNVGHAATCNSVGQTTGYFIGYSIFMALESKDFSNQFFRSIPKPYGLVSISEFMLYIGIVFIVLTTFVAIFKKEKERNTKDYKQNLNIRYKEEANGENDIPILNEKTADETSKIEINEIQFNEEVPNRNIIVAYLNVWKILKLRPIKLLILMLMTQQIPFAAFDSAFELKLVDAGVSNEKIGLLGIPLMSSTLIAILYLSKWISKKPFDSFCKIYSIKLFYILILIGFVFFTKKIVINQVVPGYYYIFLFCFLSIYRIFVHIIFMSLMSFFAKVSDPKIGGTYMTLLNTITNLGSSLPATIALWFIDILTWTNCSFTLEHNLETNGTCNTFNEKETCKNFGGTCIIKIDGFYLESGISFLFGIIWFLVMKKKIQKLQTLDESNWKIT